MTSSQLLVYLRSYLLLTQFIKSFRQDYAKKPKTKQKYKDKACLKNLVLWWKITPRFDAESFKKHEISLISVWHHCPIKMFITFKNNPIFFIKDLFCQGKMCLTKPIIPKSHCGVFVNSTVHLFTRNGGPALPLAPTQTHIHIRSEHLSKKHSTFTAKTINIHCKSH
ncbi:hypothetical protein ILYODFUR_038745 [Ilyodon furcidens]|uniref:Uncharacterized protein n=1 Tax=Ilyodon furcidens TaxID=33524 RepID=A0ABV0V0K1_9TELE